MMAPCADALQAACTPCTRHGGMAPFRSLAFAPETYYAGIPLIQWETRRLAEVVLR
jgi:hypothetical protein